jgi:diguanylate cyclase (GGDEF)-like protein
MLSLSSARRKPTGVDSRAVTPVWLVVRILAIVFAAEWAVMWLLATLFPHGLSTHAGAVLDSCLLTLAITPAIWVVLVSPLRSDARHLAHLNKKLNVVLSQRELVERRLRQLATYDSLTGLPNRSFCMKHVEKAVRRRKLRGDRFAVLFIDLDGFKPVNDNLGHSAGDALLTIAAQRLQSAVRPADLVARWGGDEFILVLEGAEERDALSVAQRIVERLSAPFLIRAGSDGNVQAHEVCISCSIGIRGSELECTNSEQILRDADLAMYTAKKSGRGRIEIFDAAIHHANMERLAEGDLRPALPALGSES